MFHQIPVAPPKTERKEPISNIEPGKFEDIESVQQEIDKLKRYLELDAEEAKKEVRFFSKL